MRMWAQFLTPLCCLLHNSLDSRFYVRRTEHGEGHGLHAEVNAMIGIQDIFSMSHDDDGSMLSSADAASAAAETSGHAYVEVLRYAPCLVLFEDRAIVFQELIERDKMVRPCGHAACAIDLVRRSIERTHSLLCCIACVAVCVRS